MTTDPLLDAIDALTKPRKTKLLRDTGGSDAVEIPSLVGQMRAALGDGSEKGGTGGAFGAKLPVAVDIRDTLADWSEVVCHELARCHVRPHRVGGTRLPKVTPWPTVRRPNRTDLRWLVRTEDDLAAYDFRANLLQLAVAAPPSPIEPPDRDRWARQVEKWVRRAEELLGLADEQKPRRVRDTVCPTCLASHVRVDERGEVLRGPAPQWVETYLAPALLMRFSDDGVLQSVECSICLAAWFGQSGIWRVAELLDEQRRHAEDADACA